jgi:hypothetical protein
MKGIKFVRVEIRKPRTDPHPEKSTTNNSEWRKGLFIVFQDYNGNEFDWMPKWDDLISIDEAKKNIEELNKKLAKSVESSTKI